MTKYYYIAAAIAATLCAAVIWYQLTAYYQKKAFLAQGIRCIASDFDGTFYIQSSPRTTRRNQRAARRWRKMGGIFIMASGRSQPSIFRTMTSKVLRRCTDYLILNDGATTISCSGKIICEDRIDDQTVRRLYRAFRDTNFIGKYAVISTSNGHEQNGFVQGSCKFRLWFEYAEDRERAEKLLDDQFSEQLVHRTFAGIRKNHDLRLDWVKPNMLNILEINLKGTSKEAAIDRLIKMIGIKEGSVTAIGDNINDLGMIEKYDGYAPETASKKVMKVVAEKHIVSDIHDLVDDQLT